MRPLILKLSQIKSILLSFFEVLNQKVSDFFRLSFSFYAERKDDLSNSILAASLFLIFFKFFFYFITSEVSPSFLNLSLYLLFTIFSYHFDAILYLKKYYFFYIYSKIIPPESTSRVCNFYIQEPSDPWEYVILEQEAVKDWGRPFREEFFAKILTLLNLFRLFVLSEPYMFFIFRFILFYFLIFNGLYFLTLSLTFLFIVSRFLFHFSDFSDYCYRSALIQMREQENFFKEFPDPFKDYTDKGELTRKIGPSLYPWIKNPEIYSVDENPVIKPTWKNASIMYYHSNRQFINDDNIEELEYRPEKELWFKYSLYYSWRKKFADHFKDISYPNWEKDKPNTLSPFHIFKNAFDVTVFNLFERETGYKDFRFELISRNKYFSIIWIPVIIIVTFYLCPELELNFEIVEFGVVPATGPAFHQRELGSIYTRFKFRSITGESINDIEADFSSFFQKIGDKKNEIAMSIELNNAHLKKNLSEAKINSDQNYKAYLQLENLCKVLKARLLSSNLQELMFRGHLEQKIKNK